VQCFVADDSGLRSHLAGDLQITACGGKSYVHTSSTAGTLQAGNRTITHPHVAEIEQALADQSVSVTHFSTVISSEVAHGLLVTVSGQLQPKTSLEAGGDDQVCVDSVLGTEKISYRYDTHELNGLIYFTLQAAIDNIEFVTSNATRLLLYIQTLY